MVSELLDCREHMERKDNLDRIAAMLTKLGGRGYSVEDAQELYDPDPDSDSDPD